MAGEMEEVEIVVHVWERESSYSELCIVNLKTGMVSKFPGGGVHREWGMCEMVALDDVIYLIGNSRPFDPTKAASPSDMMKYGCLRFSPQNPRTRAGWCFDLSNIAGFDNGWKEVPNYKSFSDNPQCVSFKGNIYLFGQGIRNSRDGPLLSSSPGEVYDPRRSCWTELPPLEQDSDSDPDWGLYVSHSPIVDHDNNRLLVHFKHINFLYAYYPDELKWVRLFPIRASSWDFVSVVVDGIILIHDPPNDTHFMAFDLTRGKWLNASVSVSASIPDFNYNLLYWEYDALIPLTPPATFCLAKNLQFLIFTLHRSSSGDPLITVLSTVSLQLDLPSFVYNYLPIGGRQARLWKRALKLKNKCWDTHA